MDKQLTWKTNNLREMENDQILGVVAAEYTTMQKGSFDQQRALLAGKPMFEPFYVKRLRPLHTHIQDGTIANDTQLLVTERRGGVIALHTRQMAYHHIAQGEVDGEFWLVAF